MSEPVIILKMDVHCLRCARRIRDFVRTMHGVEAVWASVDTGRVVVAGACLDASLLRRRIQARTRKPVAVLSDGTTAPPDEQQPAAQMVHLGPTASYSYAYPYGGGGGYGYGGGWPPAAGQNQYQYALPYGYGGGAHQYGSMMVADGTCYRDDAPSGCCTMQ